MGASHLVVFHLRQALVGEIYTIGRSIEGGQKMDGWIYEGIAHLVEIER